MSHSIINPSLQNIKNALALRANPQNAFKSIVVAGTNGKGSVCSFLELIYLNLYPELKIAKYISPHLISICERFSIDGHDISQGDFDCNWKRFIGADSVCKNLTPFEQETLFAFEYFRQEQVDIAILEVGMGGIWDATNTTSPATTLATAITNISFDHMEFLGETLDEIKKNKEGIIKTGVPHFNGSDIHALDSNPNALHGVNFLLALEIFQSINNIRVSENVKKKILQEFPARYQARLQSDFQRKILRDIAHNQASMTNLNLYIQKNLPVESKKIFVIGMLDKDYQACLDNLFSGLDLSSVLVYFCEPENPRKTSARLLYDFTCKNYPKIQTLIIENPKQAVDQALRIKATQDWLIVTGSTTIMSAIEI
ncbi:MAG: hypothetical protein RLZZ361_1393 [Cyanobacteriota bacterium]|jgi:folylpolyglutamate synthase/dihydropteroate synthase